LSERLFNTSVNISTVAGLWLLLSLIVGRARLLGSAPPPAIQGILLGLVLVVMFSFWRSSVLRGWVFGIDIRALILFHLTRFVGIYFLNLFSRGKLPYAFAVLGGWSDIVVATTALLLAFLPMKGW
jgi:hypothetical protein